MVRKRGLEVAASKRLEAAAHNVHVAVRNRGRGPHRRPPPRTYPRPDGRGRTSPTARSTCASSAGHYPGARRLPVHETPRRRVLYVGKAKSLRKRVGGHFPSRRPRPARRHGGPDRRPSSSCAQTEAEALLAGQNSINSHRPRFNIRLRDDKSYPYIAISLDEDYPRIYFTREKHRRNRVYFGPFSSAKRVRETLDLLGKGVSSTGRARARSPVASSGSPCLEYHMSAARPPCVDYVTKEEYRANVEDHHRASSPAVIARSSASSKDGMGGGVGRPGVRAGRPSCVTACARCVHYLERQRITNEAVGTLDAIAVAAEGTDANAQVFQVRDGVLADRQSFYLENESRPRGSPRCSRSSCSSTTPAPLAIPPQVVVRRGTRANGGTRGGAGRASRRGRWRFAPAERGDKRRS